MSSQRPKKTRSSSSRGSITLPPELAAHYLRNAVNNASSSSGNTSSSDDAEMKALMSMFVEIMGMSPDEGGPKNGVSFSFSSGPSSSTTSTSQWPPRAAAAAAAAASGMFSSDGQWSFDYYNEDEDEDDDDDDDADDVPDLKVSSIPQQQQQKEESIENLNDAENNADAMARQIAQDEQAAEEERAKKAAKRREKKQRKKQKAKQEAALKAQEAQVQKRSKQVQSWKSRVVAACQANEDYKMQALLSESPLGKLDDEDEDVTTHLEFLLPHCIAPSGKNEGDKACQKLATYVITTDVSVAYAIGRNGRSALHTACFEGDYFFVKLATDKAREESPLDLLCKDSGWTPLHYAVVAGCQETMDEMVLVNCDYEAKTDASLTCRTSNGEGLTALELAEIIASGKQNDEIETQGAALEEAMQRHASNKADRKRYLRTMKSMVERLRYVEETGMTPHDEVETESSKNEGEKQPSLSTTSSEDAKKKSKKKKKKQVKREQSEVSTASSVPSNTDTPKVDVPVVEKKVDPLVTALLGMGFTEEQVYAAAKACGGMERATADELVMWILGGGEESPSSPAAARVESNDTAQSEETAFVSTSNRSSQSKQAPATRKSALKKNAADLKRAQKENVQAVMREEEARAIANRIAAKREEQRRRNREWNNRAQARQKEEMEKRAQEEAKRIANERAAAQRQAAAGPMLAGKAKSAQARAAQAPAPTQILQRPSHMPVGGLQAGMMPVRPYPGGVPANAAEANMMGYPAQGYGDYDGMAQYVSSGNSVSSAGSGRNVAAAAQYVSSGNSVSSAGSGMNAMAAQYVSSGNSVSSHGSGMQYHQPMYGYPTPNVPPPGFHQFGGTPATSAGSSNLTVSEETAVSYDESGSGEIRATARSFVPTAFKPSTPASSSSSTAVSTSAPAPPPPRMGLSTTTEQDEPKVSNKDDPLASLLSAAVPGTAPPPGIDTSAALGTSVEEPTLNSVIGFDLNGTSNGPSLLGSLSLPSTVVEDSVGASIWGGSSALAPGSSSLAGFSARVTGAAPKTGDAAVEDGSGMWTSSLNQGGTSRLGSIW